MIIQSTTKCLLSEYCKKATRKNFYFRERHRDHRVPNVKKQNLSPKEKALEQFDSFYNNIFGSEWLEIRQALLGKQKYVAVVNNYSNGADICRKLENKGALNIRKCFELEKNDFTQLSTKNKDSQKDRNNHTTETKNKQNLANFSLENNLQNSRIDNDRMIGSTKFSDRIMHNFISSNKMIAMGELKISHQKENTDMKVKIARELNIHFPESLNVYTYNTDSDLPFQSPQKNSTGILNYYLMDGSSLFPVLALDFKLNNTFLDMCAAPGGKSLLALQTLYPSVITSNDFSRSRVERIFNVYKEYLCNFSEEFLRTGKIIISHNDGCSMNNGNYDRILVDVPCTTDRHSLNEDDNNIFKSSRMKERLKLPELQMELLFNALQLVKPGGIVVYSTCTMSPIQNDGVVHMALKKIFEETRIEIIVKDLSLALVPARCLFNIGNPKLLRYGQLILPSIGKNFGPTYFCKFQRIK